MYQELIDKYHDMRYFATDPVAVVRLCTETKDIEIMGLVCQWLALGNRNQIFKYCTASYSLMHGAPYQYVMSQEWQQYKNDSRCYYRMFTYADFHNLMQSICQIYRHYPTLEDALLHHLRQHPDADYLDALIPLFEANGIPRTKSSACKRLCLFLRWMIRQDSPVDLGIWTRLDQRKLLIPIDVHVGRIARQQGLLSRNATDMKAVVQLTDRCRQIFPNDPCAMDFALFGLGYNTK